MGLCISLISPTCSVDSQAVMTHYSIWETAWMSVQSKDQFIQFCIHSSVDFIQSVHFNQELIALAYDQSAAITLFGQSTATASFMKNLIIIRWFYVQYVGWKKYFFYLVTVVFLMSSWPQTTSLWYFLSIPLCTDFVKRDKPSDEAQEKIRVIDA